nr:hypothetical protein [uncultured Acetatifactor sp.]
MKLPFKKNKEVVFQKVKSQQGFTLENQERKLTDFRDIDIEDYLADMFVTADQFVILTAPMAQDKVRFVQACTHDDGIEVELGIEDEGTRLYYKMCSEEECYRIFLDFYEDRFIPDMKEYKPVEF